MEKVLGFVSSVLSRHGIYVFAGFVLLTFVVFLFCVIKKKKTAFFVFDGGFFCVFSAFFLVYGIKTDMVYFLFSALILTGEFLVLSAFFFPLKEPKKEKEIGLYKREENIKERDLCDTPLYKKINKAVISIEKTQPIKQSEDKKEDKGTELNFDHIKNVIKRLEYYPLSVADKKTVNTLSEQIEETEKNGETKESKNRINESLGAILKIMAKYKV